MDNFNNGSTGLENITEGVDTRSGMNSPRTTSGGFIDFFRNLSPDQRQAISANPADRKRALPMGLFSAGLSMLATPPRRYPYTTGEIIGRAGLQGLGMYQNELERAGRGRMEEEEMGLKKKGLAIDEEKLKLLQDKNAQERADMQPPGMGIPEVMGSDLALSTPISGRDSIVTGLQQRTAFNPDTGKMELGLQTPQQYGLMNLTETPKTIIKGRPAAGGGMGYLEKKEKIADLQEKISTRKLLNTIVPGGMFTRKGYPEYENKNITIGQAKAAGFDFDPIPEKGKQPTTIEGILARKVMAGEMTLEEAMKKKIEMKASGISINISPEDITKSTRTKIEGDIIDADNNIVTLQNIRKSFNPDYLTYKGKLIGETSKYASKLGLNCEQGFRKKQQKWLGESMQYFTNWRKWATGVAFSPEERIEIGKAIPDPLNDSPTDFKTKLELMENITQKLKKRLIETRSLGIPAPYSKGKGKSSNINIQLPALEQEVFDAEQEIFGE